MLVAQSHFSNSSGPEPSRRHTSSYRHWRGGWCGPLKSCWYTNGPSAGGRGSWGGDAAFAARAKRSRRLFLSRRILRAHRLRRPAHCRSAPRVFIRADLGSERLNLGRCAGVHAVKDGVAERRIVALHCEQARADGAEAPTKHIELEPIWLLAISFYVAKATAPH